MAERPSLTIFFPAYNDAGSIGGLVRTALNVLPTLADDYEVLVINDGSSDGTGALLDELERREPSLRVVHHPHNMGYGAALRSGFAHASKELVFYTDGDGQYDVRELTRLYARLAPGIDVVNGFKAQRADTGQRRVIGSLYQTLARVLFRLPIRDVDCDFRLLRRTVLTQVELTSSSGAICVELVRKLSASGCRFAEVPVTHLPRLHGRSQFFTFGRVSKTARDFAALWFRLMLLRQRS